jgi:hypothetical protein
MIVRPLDHNPAQMLQKDAGPGAKSEEKDQYSSSQPKQEVCSSLAVPLPLASRNSGVSDFSKEETGIYLSVYLIDVDGRDDLIAEISIATQTVAEVSWEHDGIKVSIDPLENGEKWPFTQRSFKEAVEFAKFTLGPRPE